MRIRARCIFRCLDFVGKRQRERGVRTLELELSSSQDLVFIKLQDGNRDDGSEASVFLFRGNLLPH